MNRRWILVVLALSLVASVALAQQQQQQQTTQPLPKGFRGILLTDLEDVQKKMMSLGEAIPEAKYSWRPETGVRSVSEVYVHVATSNFLIPQFAGIQPPPGITSDMEKTITDRAKSLQLLQKSFDHIRKGVEAMPDTDLEKPANFYGEKTTVEGVLFTTIAHVHEHLGQLIAYARMNNIAPPWSTREEKQEKQEKK